MSALSNDPRYAASLRSALTERLLDQGAIRTDQVAAAFEAVPRHLFVPNVSVEIAYTDDVVLMKRNEAGTAISSVSQPTVVAMMLEQADVQPGHRVLEIGSGGYNAALLSELVGADGSVTTIDIDADVTDRARELLTEAGYPGVRVVQTDGEFGWPESAPFDRILVTVTAGDIAPAWVDQLAADGRIVVPLRLRGQTRSLAFDRMDGYLRSRSSVLCGFVSMQGAGANYERIWPLHRDKVVLQIDEDQLIDPAPLEEVLKAPRVEAWSGVLLDRYEPFSHLDLWLASRFAGYCVMSVKRSAVKSGLVRPALRWGGSAVVDGATFGYLASRPSRGKNLVELGARAHGPTAAALADEIITHTRSWDQLLRKAPDPVFEAHPSWSDEVERAGTPSGAAAMGTAGGAGFEVVTRHTRFVISWG